MNFIDEELITKAEINSFFVQRNKLVRKRDFYKASKKEDLVDKCKQDLKKVNSWISSSREYLNSFKKD